MPDLLKIALNNAIKLFLTINVQFRVLDDDKSNLKEKLFNEMKWITDIILIHCISKNNNFYQNEKRVKPDMHQK